MTTDNSRADALTDDAMNVALEHFDTETLEGIKAFGRWCIAAAFPVEQPAAALIDDARECLMDVVSHHDNIVAGFAAQRLSAQEAQDSDSASYWNHEIDVARRMKAQAERALAAMAQPAPSPTDERTAMQDAFERSEFYFNGESPVERADNWKIWVAAWKAARRPVRTFVKYIITGVAELYRAQGMNNIAAEILSLIDTERAASASETVAEGADALAHEVWSAAQRAAFDSEVGSVIADAATRGIAWMSFKAGIAYALAAHPGQPEPRAEVTSALDAYKIAPVTLLEQQKRSIAERHFQGAPDVCRALKCIDEACAEMLTAARTGASS